MGRKTGRMLRSLKGLGYGSDHFGRCEICDKHVSEMFKLKYLTEWERDNGDLYYGAEKPSIYGHEICLMGKFTEEVITEF